MVSIVFGVTDTALPDTISGEALRNISCAVWRSLRFSNVNREDVSAAALPSRISGYFFGTKSPLSSNFQLCCRIIVRHRLSRLHLASSLQECLFSPNTFVDDSLTPLLVSTPTRVAIVDHDDLPSNVIEAFRDASFFEAHILPTLKESGQPPSKPSNEPIIVSQSELDAFVSWRKEREGTTRP